MAVGKVDGVTYTPPEDTGVMANIIGGLKAPMLSEGEVLDKTSAFWASAIYGFGGAVVGGLVTRKRSKAGKEAIGGWLF